MGQPCIGHLGRAGQARRHHLAITKSVRPKLVIRHGMDGSQDLPRSGSARVICEAHVQPEQRSLGDRTRGEGICHRIEPPLGTVMENMRAQCERDEHIAIEQPSHGLKSSSASAWATSSEVTAHRPAETGKPRRLAGRGGVGAAKARRSKRFTAPLMVSPSARAYAFAVA
jgi:hypothetical protein